MWKNEEQEGNRYLMVDDYKLDKVLDKSKETIGTEICDNTKTLIEKDDKLLDDVTLKKFCDVNYMCYYRCWSVISTNIFERIIKC